MKIENTDDVWDMIHRSYIEEGNNLKVSTLVRDYENSYFPPAVLGNGKYVKEFYRNLVTHTTDILTTDDFNPEGGIA